MTVRRSLSPMQKLRIFEHAEGICHICGQKIFGKPWDVEHRIPLALGGKDDETNWSPAHRACHAPKTQEDIAQIAKAKRQAAKHIGIKPRSAWRKPPAGHKWNWQRRGDGP